MVGGEGLPADRTGVLHWPVEPTVSRTASTHRSGVAHPKLLFVGTLIKEKGPEVLIAAFAEAGGAGPREPPLTPSNPL